MQNIDKSKIYKIDSKQQLIEMIKQYPLIRILTNGKTVFAWEYDVANHDEVRNAFTEITDEFTAYWIDNKGRLLHSIKIDYPVLKKFVNYWFPDCWYGKHIKEYDSHEGLPLFQKLSPAEDFIARCWEFKITAMAQPHGTLDENYKWNPGKFLLFTEDNEMPDRLPHAHVCVNINNKQYKGNPLRSVAWADKYKSIFSVRLIDYKTAEQYTPDNLIVEEEVEKDCYLNMPESDKTELVRLLNKEKTDLWCHYLLSNGDDENE